MSWVLPGYVTIQLSKQEELLPHTGKLVWNLLSENHGRHIPAAMAELLS